MSLPLLGGGSGHGSGGGGIGTPGGTEAQAFLGRTSGLDATHQNAYADLIDGLVADSIWTKLDVLRIYATQDSATALLNLKSSSYAGVTHGSPTFTADAGFTGVDASTTVYIDSQFNASIAGGQFAQNSAHISAWNITNTTSTASGGSLTGLVDLGPPTYTGIIPRYLDGKAYFRINGNAIAGTTNATARGHYISNRSASNAIQGYKDGSSIFTSADASHALPNLSFFDLCDDQNASATFGGPWQIAAASYGSSLSGTEATNFYNRLRTYMTAVGVP